MKSISISNITAHEVAQTLNKPLYITVHNRVRAVVIGVPAELADNSALDEVCQGFLELLKQGNLSGSDSE